MTLPAINISILIIEDNPGDQILLQEDLKTSQTFNPEFTVVGTLAEAFVLLRHLHFSLIFLDLFLPDSTGLESFTKLVKINSKIPIIIFSGLADTNISLKAISLGAQDFLIKGDYSNKLLEKTVLYSIERKRNLEMIEQSNEQLNTISKATNDLIWDWNLITDEVLWRGKGLEDHLPDNIISKVIPHNFWVTNLHPDERQKVINYIYTNIEKGVGSWETDHRFKRQNGTYAYFHTRGYLIKNEEEKPVRMIGSMQDISERKIAEQQVILSEQRFKSLVQNGGDLLAILDTDGNYTYVSPTSKKILGYEPEFLTGKNAFDFIHPDDAEYIRDSLAKAQTVKYIEILPFRFRNFKGEWRLIESIITNLLDDPAVYGIVVNSRDITDKKNAEEKVALEKIIRQNETTEAVVAAQESERSEIGRELHDNVNQLLGATRLYIDIARRDNENSDSLLAEATSFTLKAIEEIRKLSKSLITPLIRDIGLTDSISDMIEDIVLVHPIQIKFDPGNFNTDAYNIKFELNIFRIVQEQINNILKHAQAKLININFRQTDDELFISITDDGIGFDTTQKKKGVGISNIISRAELYKGDVLIKSAPGEGCRLEVNFYKSKLLLN